MSKHKPQIHWVIGWHSRQGKFYLVNERPFGTKSEATKCLSEKWTSLSYCVRKVEVRVVE